MIGIDLMLRRRRIANYGVDFGGSQFLATTVNEKARSVSMYSGNKVLTPRCIEYAKGNTILCNNNRYFRMEGVNSYFGDVTAVTAQFGNIYGNNGLKKGPINSISSVSQIDVSHRSRAVS